MDYNEFEWEALDPPKSVRSILIKQSLFSIPVIGLIGGGSFAFYSQFEGLTLATVLIFISFPLVVALLVINYFWLKIARKGQRGIHRYKIDEVGISIEGDYTKYEAVDKQDALEMIKQEELPYDQWKQSPAADGSVLELILVTDTGKISLNFNQEYDRQKFIRSLKEHYQQ